MLFNFRIRCLTHVVFTLTTIRDGGRNDKGKERDNKGIQNRGEKRDSRNNREDGGAECKWVVNGGKRGKRDFFREETWVTWDREGICSSPQGEDQEEGAKDELNSQEGRI